MLIVPILSIWLVSTLLGWIAFPLLYRVCPGLKDRGYAVARIAALIIVTYLAWMASSLQLLPFTTASVGLGAAVLALASFFSVRKIKSDFFGFLKKKRRIILIMELVFLLSFCIFLYIVALNPNIDPDSERFMDYALLNGIDQTVYFPPLDPWFAGTTMNYYYYGYIITAALHKLTPIGLPLFFNLALALIYALFVLACFGIGYNCSGKISYGLLAVLLLMFIGNLSGIIQIMGKGFSGFSAFEGARVMIQQTPDGTILDYPINEFPIFSLFYGDLHPYVITYAVNMAILNLIFGLFLLSPAAAGERRDDRIAFIGTLLLLSVSIGCLVGAHTWDYPVYLGGAVIVLIYRYLADKKSADPNDDAPPPLSSYLFPALGLIILSFILYLPFNLPFLAEQAGKERGGIGLVGLRTPIGLFLVALGIYLFFLAVFLLARLIRIAARTGGKGGSFPAPFIILMIGVLAVIAFGSGGGAPLPTFIFILLLLAGVLVILGRLSGTESENFGLILALVALFLTLFCEFFFLKDHYQGGGYERMNTMFKAYTNVWLLLGAASVFFIYHLNQQISGRAGLRRLWRFCLILTLLIGFLFTLGGLGERLRQARRPLTLDGLAYAENEPPANHKKEWRWDRRDLQAARWLKNNTEGRPVILETTGNAYDWASRISTFSSLPTLVGWVNHEAGWRNDWEEPGRRRADTDTLYRTTNLNAALHLIEKYDIRYIYVGGLEREKYPRQGLEKFRRIGREIYRDGPVVIWDVGKS